MSKFALIFGVIILLLNTVLGFLITNYESFNWIFADFVIVINVLIVQKFIDGNISDGFKVSGIFILFILALISFILAILSPNKIQDNYFFVGFLFILMVQITLYFLFKSLYSKGKK